MTSTIKYVLIPNFLDLFTYLWRIGQKKKKISSKQSIWNLSMKYPWWNSDSRKFGQILRLKDTNLTTTRTQNYTCTLSKNNSFCIHSKRLQIMSYDWNCNGRVDHSVSLIRQDKFSHYIEWTMWPGIVLFFTC